MDDPEPTLTALRDFISRALEACTDIDLLDLIYQLLSSL